MNTLSVNHLRPLVSFLVVGSQKAGTTTLHAQLSKHPGLFLPAGKELHFFDRDDLDWSKPAYNGYHSAFSDAGPSQICGEVTPVYMFQRRFLERIHAYSPAMKLVAILRDPVQRAYSNWRMEMSRNTETMSFSSAIREGRSRVSNQWRRFSYVERGLYSEQIRNMLELFGKDQCHFLLSEDLSTNLNQVMTNLSAFLGCSCPVLPFSPQHSHPFEMRDFEPISEADACCLRDIYRDRRTGAAATDCCPPG